MTNPLSELVNAVQKVVMLVRVYNKPDSAITGITKREKRRDQVFRQI